MVTPKRQGKRGRKQADPWVSVLAASKMLRVSRPTVYQMAARKELRHQTVAGRMVVRRADVERMAA